MFNVSESPLSHDDSLSIRNYHIMPICLIKKQQLQTYIDTLTVDQSSISVVYMWLQSSICGGATGSDRVRMREFLPRFPY